MGEWDNMPFLVDRVETVNSHTQNDAVHTPNQTINTPDIHELRRRFANSASQAQGDAMSDFGEQLSNISHMLESLQGDITQYHRVRKELPRNRYQQWTTYGPEFFTSSSLVYPSYLSRYLLEIGTKLKTDEILQM